MNINRGIGLLLAAFLLMAIPELANSQKIMTVIKNHSNLSSFAAALEANGIDEELSGNGPFTIFAPINESFDRETSGKNITSSSIRNLLLNHIMTGYATERNMKVMARATSMGGVTLVLKPGENPVKINNAEVLKMNIRAQNGVLHIIKGILK